MKVFEIPPDVPIVAVVSADWRSAIVACLYCDGEHLHEIRADASGWQWRAPGCGWQRTPADRARGYRFTLTEGLA